VINVYSPDGNAGSEDEVFSILPRVKSFSPSSGTAGKLVAIRGSGFENVSDVSFGGVSATVTSTTLNTITALVPDTAPRGTIVVTSAVGTGSSTSSFKPVPRLVSFDPSPAVAGAVVTLTGTNLAGATSLRLGSRTLPVTVDSPTRVHTTLPANAVTGPLTITTPAGTSAALTFTVTPGS
jgi:hypothetical protein